MSRPMGSLEGRFWPKVDKTDGCWIWTGCKGNGYGYIAEKQNGVWKREKAAKVAWELLHKRKFPEGKLVCHTCDNRICVRPDHIYPGTKLSNCRDAWRNGRIHIKRGEEHHAALLTWEQVREIRFLWSSRLLSQRRLASKYGVARRTIRSVLNHKSYKENE